jgi:hypothetical protein
MRLGQIKNDFRTNIFHATIMTLPQSSDPLLPWSESGPGPSFRFNPSPERICGNPLMVVLVWTIYIHSPRLHCDSVFCGPDIDTIIG